MRLIILFIFLPGILFAQSQPNGYQHRNDTTFFLFNETDYPINKPDRVVVTGSFRGWDQNMDDPNWQLRKSSETVWTLAVPNPTFAAIPPQTEFKFRINAGEWLSPPTDAPNEKGGNLVFMNHMTPQSLHAELRPSGNIWVKLSGVSISRLPEDYRLTDAHENEIAIAEILPNLENELLLIPAEPIDKRRVYFLSYQNLTSHCSFDGWFRELYSHKELGANVEGTQTSFRLFAPRAEMVKLYLYDGAKAEKARETIEMKVDADGVWEYSVSEDLKGTWYDFTIHGANDPGNHFFESNPVHVSDPYARVNDEAWGRSRVWHKTKAATALKNGIPPLESVIAYEVHVQDFTSELPVDESLKGTLPAMFQAGLKNKKGKSVGFDYLVDLGINVVHLMPVQEFLHYKDEIWKASFEKDPYMIQQGINEENYQWGYRTSHAFAIENRFRQKGSENGAERDQFRDLVQAFHDKGIAVIIDIVPNHSAENMDKVNYYFHWNAIDKQYHYRTKDLEHIGEYGNEVKTENRPMVQRWLIDQCKHFIEEFGIDGFRIDLAGQIDRQTLIKLRRELGEDIIIYGEPWIASADPNYENNPSWDWYKHNSPITFFQDDARNAFKGPTGNP
ncbi:MAG: alpha-amylase family glycosyl hydrolase, partial [Bacteroidota bacterium]